MTAAQRWILSTLGLAALLIGPSPLLPAEEAPNGGLTGESLSLLKSIRQREVPEIRVEYSHVWRALSGYAARDLRDELSLPFWRAVADPAFQPVPLVATRELQIGGYPGLRPITVRFAFAVLRVPGQDFLFGFPEYEDRAPARTYKEHVETARRRGDNALAAGIEAKGPERWGLLMVPLDLRGRERVDARLPLPTVEIESWHGRFPHHYLKRNYKRVPVPDGSSTDLPPHPYTGKKLHVAVDWSDYVKNRSSWLLRELQALVEALPAGKLVGEGVFLVSDDQETLWTTNDLGLGRWPSPAPPAHQGNSTRTLVAAMNHARRSGGDARLVFLFWNSTSFPDDSTALDSGLKGGGILDPPQFARDMGLVLFQCHGERLASLERLVGERNYNIFDYNSDGPSALVLPPELR